VEPAEPARRAATWDRIQSPSFRGAVAVSIFPAELHSTNRDLGRMTLGWASPLELEEGMGWVPLWTTTDGAGLQDSGTPVSPGTVDPATVDPAELAPRVVAAAIAPEEGADGARLIVVGDADFLDNTFVQQGTIQNLYFGANAVDWLAQEEALISIRSKDRMPPPLVFPSDGVRSAVRWGSLLGVPVLIVLFGIVRVGGRRRRAERRWGEVVA